MPEWLDGRGLAQIAMSFRSTLSATRRRVAHSPPRDLRVPRIRSRVSDEQSSSWSAFNEETYTLINLKRYSRQTGQLEWWTALSAHIRARVYDRRLTSERKGRGLGVAIGQVSLHAEKLLCIYFVWGGGGVGGRKRKSSDVSCTRACVRCRNVPQYVIPIVVPSAYSSQFSIAMFIKVLH